MQGVATVKGNCFETQHRRVCKESPVQRIVINIECLHQAINIIASNKDPFYLKKNELDLCAFYDTQKSLLTICERSVDTYIPSQVTILCIKPHFMYHDNQRQELNSKGIFGFSTLN